MMEVCMVLSKCTSWLPLRRARKDERLLSCAAAAAAAVAVRARARSSRVLEDDRDGGL